MTSECPCGVGPALIGVEEEVQLRCSALEPQTGGLLCSDVRFHSHDLRTEQAQAVKTKGWSSSLLYGAHGVTLVLR